MVLIYGFSLEWHLQIDEYQYVVKTYILLSHQLRVLCYTWLELLSLQTELHTCGAEKNVGPVDRAQKEALGPVLW